MWTKIKGKGWPKVLVLVLGISLVAASCNSKSNPTEQDQVRNNQDSLVNAVPIPQLHNSLERSNISKRLTTFDDPNKVTYTYLVSFGKVMSFYTVKGKITSSSKRLTANNRIVDDCGHVVEPGNGSSCSGYSGVVESPSLDGTYGPSDEYIYFWTTDGAYVQWSGDYMVSDQPLKLTTQPELVREVK